MTKKFVSMVLAVILTLTSVIHAFAYPGPLEVKAAAAQLPGQIASSAFSAASAGVGLIANSDAEKIDEQMAGPTQNGSWLEFNINVPEDGTYTFSARVQSAGDKPTMNVLVDNVSQLTVAEGDPSGEGVPWFTTAPQRMELKKGEHILKIEFGSTFDLSWIQLERYIEARPIEESNLIEIIEYDRANKSYSEFEDSKDPEAVIGTIPKGVYAGDWFEFDVYVSEEMAGRYDLYAHVARATTNANLVGVQFFVDGERKVDINRAGTGGWFNWVNDGPYAITLSPGKHVIKMLVTKQCNVSLFKLERSTMTGDAIRIDAVDYTSSSSGIGQENCSNPEVSSGKNPSSTMAGAWMEYNLFLSEESAGEFLFTTHVARSGSAENAISYVCYIDGKLVSNFSRPGTDGWQNWKSSDPVGLRLAPGNHVIRIEFKAQFNLSLLKFERLTIDPDAAVTAVNVVGEEPFEAVKGKSTTFFAQALGDKNCNPFVTWELEGSNRASIDSSGVLTVPFSEEADQLVLRARSESHPDVVSKDITVKLIDESDEHSRLSREIAQEGIVLLKNEDDVLPLENGENVALLGLGQVSYVKGGSGSGDVESAFVRTIPEGLQDKAYDGKIRLDDALVEFYNNYYYTNGGSVSTNEPEFSLVEPLMDAAAAKENATAVVVLSRRWGEGSDVDTNPGSNSYQFSAREKELIEASLEKFEKVVLVLNIGGVMDLNWAANVSSSTGRKIDSILLAWQPGMEGGIAVADALCGDVNPSGRLTDTFVTSFKDYPSSGTYKNVGSNSYVSYEEDIFVGYRYFETFAPEKVVYPFGFGLSYTDFAISDVQAVPNEAKGTIDVSAKVTNNGQRAGKEVVQVYFSAPDGLLPKASKELAAFQKTGEIAPGESQTVTMSFDIDEMASYDDIGKTGKESAYVLEPGVYDIYVGKSVRDNQAAGSYTVDELTVTQQLTKIFQPVDEENQLQRRLDGTGPASYETTIWNDASAAPVPASASSNAAASAVKDGAASAQSEGIIKLSDVAEDPSLMSAFIAQLTDEELIRLTYGSGTSDFREILDGGITATTMENLAYGIPRLQTSDGPAGIRNYKYTSTAWPCATMQACTWNPELVKAAGEALAKEARELKVLTQYLEYSLNNHGSPIMLTPSTNIHRDPKCGRNFEYYSEDPFISGIMAGAQINGIQSQGVSATLKHFSANNSETNRKNSDSMVSERAMREIYLKPFEVAISTSNPWCVMSSYNKINGKWASMHEDLLQTVLRDEWEYKGMVMTDWGALAPLLDEIKAGSALKMPGIGSSYDQAHDVAAALESGDLTRNQLERVVRDMMYMELHTYLFDADKTALESYHPVEIDASDLQAHVDFKFYYENEPVSLYVEGLDEETETLSVSDENGSPIDVEKIEEGVYRFAMPGSKVFVQKVSNVPAPLPGDVTGDGVLGLQDLIQVKVYILTNEGFTDEQKRLADVNGDGRINILDLLHIKLMILNA
ncbi:glycoside hydrolase family 3 C-terminal domain-containing protein [Candidatus Soleaferrea massiliensis]|uniref:glycoside hydrolase family 3 C-terminal domain-containing protein n=1 Tax=Candidatus Soleaferrea massiliensis TaxID=1470354 RepID=UPI00069481DF|nr:glycoside hydrolase family 3 C-terminal domain-containing protein [Candidatus Soleaferrea massiliensis]